MPDSLPPIPYVDVTQTGTEGLVRAAPDRLADLLGLARKTYGRLVLALADRLSERWLARSDSPLFDELQALAPVIDRPGTWMLNLSYEWSCSAVVAAPTNGVPRILRTLDWPLEGLGRNLVIGKRRGPAGDYDDVTWPGFVGLLTAVAPGRFAATINQAPLPRRTGLWPLDWVLARIHWWKSQAVPPTHLLRQVFDECRTYDEAKAMLRDTPLCLPVFFTLAGTEPGQGCVIERTADRARVRELPAAAANHWQSFEIPSYARGRDSAGRLLGISQTHDLPGDDLSWLVAPVLCADTRLACVLEPASGRLVVQGWEIDGAVSAVFDNRA